MVNFEVNDPVAGKEFPVGLLGSYMATQVELVRGASVLREVVDRLHLTRVKAYAAGFTGDPEDLTEWVVTRVQKDLLVEQGKYGSQLIHVIFVARTPDLAAEVANAVADVYAAQQVLRLTGPARERAKRSTEQLATLKNRVDLAQTRLTAFREKNGLVNSDAKADVDMHASLIESLKGQLSAQSLQLAALQPTLGPRHPQILELHSQVGATRRALGEEMRAYSGKTDAERLGVKYQLELESANSVYARALDSFDQVLFASGSGYTNVESVSRATRPSRPKAPKILVMMILATMIAFVAALGLPLVYERLNRRVRCRDDMERDHGIPVLVELGPRNYARRAIA
jgi:uncharacterized protein involved in exopolysaccharide biosynthesis